MFDVTDCRLGIDAPHVSGKRVLFKGEWHEFATEEAAQKRAAFVGEALPWVGTPFIDCADIKGRKGGVDCAMLLVRASVDSGLLAPFDPRPYPPRWHLHKDEERFLEWVVGKLGAREIEEPRFGDLIVYRYGRCFSHGAIVISSTEIVHAWFAARMCLTSLRREPLLNDITWRGATIPRPRKAFEMWGG
jgi:cell wall-associated NlpC family hydrolase